MNIDPDLLDDRFSNIPTAISNFQDDTIELARRTHILLILILLALVVIVLKILTA